MNNHSGRSMSAPPGNWTKEGSRLRVRASRSSSFGDFFPGVLLQIAICAVPAGIFLAIDAPSLAGRYVWFATGLFVLTLLALARIESAVVLVVGLSPLLNLLRQSISYSLLTIVMVALALVWLLGKGLQCGLLKRRAVAVAWLACMVVVYYLATQVSTGIYWKNLRMFELLGTVVLAFPLLEDRRAIATALCGTLVSTWSYGIGMYVGVGVENMVRLGAARFGGEALGNPFNLGLPLAYVILALIVDGGRWSGLTRRPGLRYWLASGSAVLLALSASRAGWAVLICGLGAGFVLSPVRQVRSVAAAAILGGVLLAFVSTDYGEPFQMGIERSFGEERTLAQATSGRSDQWRVAGTAVTSSKGHLVFGFGAGRNDLVFARYSAQLGPSIKGSGKLVVFHSIVLQILVETGLVGLMAFLAWLVTAMGRAARWCRGSGLMLPLCFGTGYCLTGLTVSGNDVMTGLLLGVPVAAAGLPYLRRGLARGIPTRKAPGGGNAWLQGESGSRLRGSRDDARGR